jgi:hypothetical protein
MHFHIICIFVLFILNLEVSICVPLAARMVMHSRSRSSTARTIKKREKEWAEQRKKCDYTKKLFDTPPNTCPVPYKIYSYMNIYDSYYKEQLWTFHNKYCIPKQANIMFVFLMLLSFMYYLYYLISTILI